MKKIFILTGEPSGDKLASTVISKLKQSNLDKVLELLNRIIQFPHNLYLKFGQIPDWHNAKSVIEHQQIIEALESGDRPFAEIRMKAHTESVRTAFRELWSREES